MKYLVFIAQTLDPNKTNLPNKHATSPDTLSHILSLVFVVVGALAFLMLVLGGFRYVVAQGDPAQLATARRQMFYSLAGLVIAASAAAIVNFILGRL